MVGRVMQSKDPGGVLEELSAYWRQEDLGDMRVLKEEPWKLEIRNCYECLGLRYVGQRWCALKEGLIESVLADKTGVEYSVMEEECCGTEGERCLFRVGS
ncbi:MAG: V4R domain-containing protein [Candidatus Geothermarchaeales archaeon]